MVTGIEALFTQRSWDTDVPPLLGQRQQTNHYSLGCSGASFSKHPRDADGQYIHHKETRETPFNLLSVCVLVTGARAEQKLSTEQTSVQYQRFPPRKPHKVLCEAGIAAHAYGTRLSGRAGVDPRSGSAFPPPCT